MGGWLAEWTSYQLINQSYLHPPTQSQQTAAHSNRLVLLYLSTYSTITQPPTHPPTHPQLQKECENALKTLSTSTQVDIEIDSLYEGFDLR